MLCIYFLRGNIMKKVYIHFKSNVLFALEINGEYVNTTKNINQSIDILSNENSMIFVRFTPISNSTTFLPYSQCIEIINGNIKNSSNNIEIIEFSNKHFLINLKAIPISSFNHSLITKTFDKIYICVNQSYPTIISAYFNNILKNTVTLANQSCNTIITQKNNCIVIKSLLINGSFEICVLDKNSLSTLYQSTCETIEEESELIKILTRQNNNSNYALITNYDTINQKQTYETILLSKSKKRKESKEIIGYNFLLAIQNKDFKIIESLCISAISEKLTSEMINNIFGNISNIYYDPFADDQPTFILSCENATKKIYIKINNNEITDFIIDD